MKDFYDMVAQVETKNKEQRMFLAQSLLPFFNALSQKAAYNEQYARSLKEEEDRNMRFGESVKEYQTTGVVPTNAPIALQSMALQTTETERIRKEGIVNKMQQLGLGKEFQDYMAANPDEDIDVTFGKFSETMDEKEIDKKAQSLGSTYYNLYLAKRKDKVLPMVAFADAMDRKQAAEMASRGGGGSGGGSNMSPDAIAAANTAQMSREKERTAAHRNLVLMEKGINVKIGEADYLVRGRRFGGVDYIEHIAIGKEPKDTATWRLNTKTGKYVKFAEGKWVEGTPNAATRQALQAGNGELTLRRQAVIDAENVNSMAYDSLIRPGVWELK